VREDELPLTLPPTQDFKPSGRPESPLAKITDWVQTTDPATGSPHILQAVMNTHNVLYPGVVE